MCNVLSHSSVISIHDLSPSFPSDLLFFSDCLISVALRCRPTIQQLEGLLSRQKGFVKDHGKTLNRVRIVVGFVAVQILHLPPVRARAGGQQGADPSITGLSLKIRKSIVMNLSGDWKNCGRIPIRAFFLRYLSHEFLRGSCIFFRFWNCGRVLNSVFAFDHGGPAFGFSSRGCCKSASISFERSCPWFYSQRFLCS